MFQFVVGAAAGYVLGTKAGRKRFYQIKNAYEKTVNSPVTKGAINATRKAVANKLDPEPRMRELKDHNASRRGRSQTAADKIYVPDED